MEGKPLAKKISYERVMPEAKGPSMTVDLAELTAAIDRVIMMAPIGSTVKFQPAKDVLTLIATRPDGQEATARIDIESFDDIGPFAASGAYFLDWIRTGQARKAKHGIVYQERPGSTLVCELAGDDGLSAAIMPIRVR